MANTVDNYLLATGDNEDIEHLRILLENIDETREILSQNRFTIYDGSYVKSNNHPDFDGLNTNSWKWDLVVGKKVIVTTKYSSYGFEHLVDFYREVINKSNGCLMFSCQSKSTDLAFTMLSREYPTVTFYLYIDEELAVRTSKSSIEYILVGGIVLNGDE